MFLHGLLGRASNWQGFAKRFVAARPEYSALLVDLRMHGESQGLPPPHTLAAAAADVAALMQERSASVVVGHSFGGKLSMRMLADPPPSLREVWVLDASPSPRLERDENDTTLRVLTALRDLPPRFASRAEFVADVTARGVPTSLGPWLAKNLVPADDGQGLRFGLDLDAMFAFLNDHDRVDVWALIEAPPEGVALRFVIGGRSTTISARDRQRLRMLATRGVLEVHELPEAGHWVHVDDPEGLMRVLVERLGL